MASAPSTTAPRGLVLLPPNRVWRTYTGGRVLDELGGITPAVDQHFPEDWIGSTTRASNVGRETIREGISQVVVRGETYDLAQLIAADPEFFLGAAHLAKFGPAPMLLVKFLDSALRLHFQVHPTSDFARRFLGSPSGKTEAYHVLAVRDSLESTAGNNPDSGAEPTGYIHLGFQRPPSRDALRRMIETQDTAALEACFDRIAVKPGDTYVVPGGVPHALGAGVFLVEIQEPSDLVVRFEFSRGGSTLPEAARFMGRSLEFCLDVFDLTAWPAARLAVEAESPAKRRRALGPDSWQDDLVDAARTPCFRVRRSRFGGEAVKQEEGFHIGIVTSGAVTISVDGESQRLGLYDKFFAPAGLGALSYAPEGSAEILECYPPQS